MANDTDLVPKKKDDDEEDEERRTRYAPDEAETARPMPPVSFGEPDVLGEMPRVQPQPGESAATRGRIGELEQRLNPPRAQGTLPRIGRVFRNIGEIAGGAVAPGVMMQIPGTRLNTMAQLAAERERLEQEQQRESMEPLRAAQTEEALGRATEARAAARAKGLSEPEPGESNTFTQSDEAGNVIRQWQRYKNPADPEHPRMVEVPVPGQQMPTTGAAAAAPPQAGTIPAVSAPQAAPMAGPIVTGKPSTLTAEQRLEQNMRRISQIPEAQRTPEDAKLYGANYPAMESKLPMTADMRMQRMKEIAATLKGTDVPPDSYTIPPGATGADAKEILANAQKAANEYRMRTAPEAAQRRKDEREMGYAMNPTNNKLEYMNRAQADDFRSLFEPVKDTKTDRQSIRQLNDIQKNISEYQRAIDSRKTSIEHWQAMQRINAGVNERDVSTLGFITMGAAMDMMEQSEVANAWKELDKTERAIMIGYLRAKGAMIAYNRVISGSARTNKEALAVEWNNLPLPYVGGDVANDQMRAMQENIDQVSLGFPTNLPGMKLPERVREETERPAEKPAAAAGAKGKGNWNPVTGRYE